MSSFQDILNRAIEDAVKSGKERGVLLIHQGDDGRVTTQFVTEDEFAAIQAGNADTGFDVYGQRYEQGEVPHEPYTKGKAGSNSKQASPDFLGRDEDRNAGYDPVPVAAQVIYDIICDPNLTHGSMLESVQTTLRILVDAGICDYHQRVIVPRINKVLEKVDELERIHNHVVETATALEARAVTAENRYAELLRKHNSADSLRPIAKAEANRAYVGLQGQWSDAYTLNAGELYFDANGLLRRVVIWEGEKTSIPHDADLWPVGDRHIHGRKLPDTRIAEVTLGLQVPDRLTLVAEGARREADKEEN